MRATSAWFILLLLAVAALLPLQAAGSVPAKLATLFPKGATELWCSEIPRMGFMTFVTCTATLPKTTGCLFNTSTPHALHFEIKAYDISDEMGAMQAEMMSGEMAKELQSMRKQLEKRRENWKGLNVGHVTPVSEEKVGKGTILSTGYESLCADVNPDRPRFTEVCLRGYFFNGRTLVTVELQNHCSGAEARALVAQLFEKIDRTDFKELM